MNKLDEPETSSSVVCGAKECTGVGAELGTDDLVGADLVEVRNFRSFAPIRSFALIRSFAPILHFLEAVQYRCGLGSLSRRRPLTRRSPPNRRPP